ncbi:hypothetical protein RX398_07465 [Collinsella aerofaciens]|uniref:hypothetical protein n=1 Tax=Collinsella aerofaciens TaxID=74426 RepID=UPI00290C1519|nr:hypothetical protein [Collinsella aerofaciens]MDU8577221.1 hypothetical protein [Collinsella aerofaciens]
MRKQTLLIPLLASCILLSGCASQGTKLDQQITSIGEITADSWDELQSLNSQYKDLDADGKQDVEHYRDLEKALAECSKLRTDQQFSKDLKKSIRWRQKHKDDTDWATLVDAELAKLEKYRSADFSSETVKNSCTKYLEGLDTQKAALGEAFKSDEQIEWQKGMVLRYEALGELYKETGFLATDDDFVANYIAGLDKEKKLLAALEALEADIDSQTDRIANEETWTDYSVSFEVENNTDYQFDTAWECSLKNESGTVTENSTCQIDNVKPRSRYTVTFYFTNPDSGYGGFDWNNYYTDIVY